ncbi:RidA family protein [Paraburkholderia hospita]|uniref:RidA family protein n=1 Tax=Paraburkholderia hospita TaxID=169430 RepID=UPI00027182EE|nr:RidA family protein [Paraburkholderia hospita]EUC20810.1 Endoribonuclease L-PSP [Burkholderia sp. BT03]SKD08330.1 Enamine deaminase RidA, house cleaning of reactive enamine intermediates, YjgF/YER057c/UK114 family [Paraburkholderia hospita]
MIVTQTPEDRLAALGLTLPETVPPLFSYISTRLAGDMLYISGQGPREQDGSYRAGKVGTEISVERAYQDARLTGLHLLAVAKEALGELSRVKAVVKLFGMVNATPDFEHHPQVINGCSELLVDVLGEAGRHARSAIGMGSLPGRMTVEIEAVLQVD